MAETLRIEIPIETIDKTEPEMTNLIKKVEKLGKEAEETGNKTRRSSEYVTQFDRQAERTERSLSKWAKEKYEILLEAKDRITPVLSVLGNGLRGFAGKSWNVTMRAVDLVTSPVRGIINLLKNPVFQAGAVLGVSVGLKDTIDTYKDFEAAMSQVQAISGATGSDVVKLTNKAKEMGATTKFTAEESAEAFNYMAMAGWKTEDMLSGIEGILSLAAASGEDLAATSDIVTDALTAFKLQASDAGHFSDVLAAAASNANTTVSGMGETFKYAGAMAGALGYRIEDVALATGLMANAGIKGTMAGTSLNAVFTRLSTDTNGARKAVEELGIHFFDDAGKARALADVLSELRTATEGYTDEQKTNLANTIAGMEAQKGLLAILNASAEDYEELSDAINHADGAAAEMSETMMDNLQGSITLLQSAVDGVKISFGERLSPYVRSLADWLTMQMPEVEQGLDEFMDWFDAKVDRMQRKFNAIADTNEWQDADFFGKVRIAWEEFIAEPFSEWWNSTGKAKFAGFAQDIGLGIGAGLKAGIMTLLGIDIEETLDEGVSIGASFAKGFSEGFDFNAVSEKLWQGFKNLWSNAWKLLPGGESADLSSVLSAVMLRKIATPFISMGRGAAGLGKGMFGVNPTTGTSLVGSLIGKATISEALDGSAVAGGSGLLGLFGKTGVALGSGATSGAGLAVAGGGAIAGGIAAGATLISGAMDAYTAIKSDNEDERNAYVNAAGWKVGGVATGAALGAAIGSVIPVLGTAVGALVGAGAGGIAGWIRGNKFKEEYQDNVEQMRKEAEKAQKVFDVTGRSIDEVTFKNEELAQAMNDSAVSASQFALMYREECAEIARDAFGDVSLTLAEIKKVAGDITFDSMGEGLDELTAAAEGAAGAVSSLKESASRLKKENWKAGLGMKLSDTDIDSYRNAVEAFIQNSVAVIDGQHYEAAVALKLLLGEETDTSVLDSYYADLNSQISDRSDELREAMNISLEDGVIILDESAELESLQSQISEITNKLAEAKTDAEMQALQIKYNGAALDIDSFNALQEELQANVASASEQYENALTLTLTNLNLQLADGAITQEEYDNAVVDATDGYYAQINEMNARVNTFNMESIAAAFEEGLDGFMPEVEGTMAEKLQIALNNAVLAHPDVGEWEEADLVRWMGLDRLGLDTAQQDTIAAELIQAALAIPKGTKETLLQEFKSRVPTAEEIMAALDWDAMTENDWNTLMELVDGPPDSPSFGLSAEAAAKPMAEYYGDYFDTIKKRRSEELHDALEKSEDNEKLSGIIEQYMSGTDAWKEAGAWCGNMLNEGISESIEANSPIIRSVLQSVLDMASENPFAVIPTVKVMPEYQVNVPAWARPSVRNTGGYIAETHISTNAAGGYVSGGPQLSWLAEEGYGEFVIPTNPSRRARALDLYEQAGAALGVSGYADGGYAGGSVLSDAAADYNLFSEANRNAPIACTENTDRNYSGDTAEAYEPASAEVTGTAGGTVVQVKVEVSPEYVIHAENGKSEEDILRVIRRHMKEMADELGGEIAEKLDAVFSNMPVKEA